MKEEECPIKAPWVLNKSKVDSYCYKYYLDTGMILDVCECDGPYEEGGQVWYDLTLSSPLYEYDESIKSERISRLTVSVNAKHIVMVSEAES